MKFRKTPLQYTLYIHAHDLESSSADKTRPLRSRIYIHAVYILSNYTRVGTIISIMKRDSEHVVYIALGWRVFVIPNRHNCI